MKQENSNVPSGANYPVEGDFNDHVPLFLIPFINTIDSGGFGYYGGEYKTLLTRYFDTEVENKTPFHIVVSNKIAEMNVQTANAATAFFETFESLIQDYCNDDSTIRFIDYSATMHNSHEIVRNSYENIFACQGGLSPCLVQLRSQAYYSGCGALFQNKGNLIWTLAVKKEHVKYVKLCYLLGKPIDPKVLVFMSQTNFDTKSTFNKPLRTAFRKQFKDWLVDNEVQMVEVDFNSMLCGNVKIPDEITSIRAVKDWETNTIIEFIESYKVENDLTASGVELSF